VKIICAGYPKTGTKSLHDALDTLGCDKIYDYLEHTEYFMDEYIDVFKGDRDIRHVLDRYAADQVDVVIDMPTSFLFEHFHSRWPDAKVILTVRDEDAWFKSIKKMNVKFQGENGWMAYLSTTANKFKFLGNTLYTMMLGSHKENPWLWKMHYRRHNTYVKDLIPAENLLVYEVTEGWEPLCKFLNKEVPDRSFPMTNVAGSKGNILERIMNETEYAARAKKEVMCSVFGIILATGGACAAAWYWYTESQW